MGKVFNEILRDERERIDGIDKKMQELFKERMNLAFEIAKKKAENGLPIFDAIRETELKSTLLAEFEDEALRGYYEEFIEKILELSKKLQEESIKNI